jgi:hypothetical protein
VNRLPDVEPVLRAYLADTGDRAPDRVLVDVAARIALQPRRTWRLRGRSVVNTYVKLAAGLAAVLVVAVVGWQLLPRDGGQGSQQSPSPTASPTASPPAAPSPTVAATGIAVAGCPEGVLAGGTCRLRPLASAPSLTVDAVVPAGWFGNPPCCLSGPVGEANGPDGIALHFLTADTIFSDPCHWNVNGSGPFQPGDVEVGPSVDELATALAASSAYEATTPVDVTIGGFAGKRVDLQLPPGDCDRLDGNGVYIVFGGPDGYFYAQGDGSDWQVSIVDVDGTRLIVALFSYAGTSAADLSAAQAIIDSLVITP